MTSIEKRIYDKKYRKANKIKIKKRAKIYHNKNKKKIQIRKIKYYNKNKTSINKRTQEYRNKNKHKIKKYYQNNKEKINKQSNKRRKYRRKTDHLYKLTHNIRKLIHISLTSSGVKKNSKTATVLGCSFKEFKHHIESQFELWMNWGNYGNWNGIPKKINVAWDIDHIMPTSSAKTEGEVIALNHYSNFQPLCSYTNRYIKSDNMNFKSSRPILVK